MVVDVSVISVLTTVIDSVKSFAFEIANWWVGMKRKSTVFLARRDLTLYVL